MENTGAYMITERHLRGACKKQLYTFCTEWPEGAALTMENVRRAQALDLDLDWYADHHFSAPLRRAYFEGRAALQLTFDEGAAPLRVALDEGATPVQLSRDEGIALLWFDTMLAAREINGG